MTITERRIGDVTILAVSGRLVFFEEASALRARINDLVDEARLNLVLDLRDVSYIDSFGVGVIAARYLSLRRKGGDLKLLSISERAAHVLGRSGLLRIFDSFDSEEEAVKSFASGAGA